MKTKIIVLVVLLNGRLLSEPFKVPTEVNTEALLKAIAEVETGTTNFSRACPRIGRNGERSAWQIKKVVWDKLTSAKFQTASTDAAHAKRVAHAHLENLKYRVLNIGKKPDPYTLAMMWNSGKNKKEYAARVLNLYQEYHGRY